LTQFDPLDPSNRQIFELLKIQDASDRHFEKSQNRHISATVLPIATKFGMVTNVDLLDHGDRQNF